MLTGTKGSQPETDKGFRLVFRPPWGIVKGSLLGDLCTKKEGVRFICGGKKAVVNYSLKPLSVSSGRSCKFYGRYLHPTRTTVLLRYGHRSLDTVLPLWSHVPRPSRRSPRYFHGALQYDEQDGDA